MSLKPYFEMIGRFGVVLTMTITMNRTEWYQNLPFQTLTNSSFYTWVFAVGIVLSMMWIIVPCMSSHNIGSGRQ